MPGHTFHTIRPSCGNGSDPGRVPGRRDLLSGPGAVRPLIQPPLLRSLTVSDAQSVLEDRLDAHLGQPGVDLRAAAVHQHATDANAGQQDQVRDDTGLGGAKGRLSSPLTKAGRKAFVIPEGDGIRQRPRLPHPSNGRKGPIPYRKNQAGWHAVSGPAAKLGIGDCSSAAAGAG